MQKAEDQLAALKEMREAVILARYHQDPAVQAMTDLQPAIHPDRALIMQAVGCLDRMMAI